MPENYKKLFLQYLNDSLSDEEAEKLIDAIRAGESLKELIPEEIFAHSPMINSDVEVDKEVIYKQLKSRLNNEASRTPVVQMQYKNRAWVGYAAAILLLFGAALYIWNIQRIKNPPEQNLGVNQLKKEVYPGGNKATLTLADGSIIVLDSAMNGNIAQQGASTVKKSADGEIIYHTDQANVS
ncbi:MAG: hypothetical protein ABI687_04000, partial [Flavitalea sp.]